MRLVAPLTSMLLVAPLALKLSKATLLGSVPEHVLREVVLPLMLGKPQHGRFVDFVCRVDFVGQENLEHNHSPLGFCKSNISERLSIVSICGWNTCLR